MHTIARPERQAILDSLDRFIRDELQPAAESIDREKQFPRDLYRRIGELGILGLWVPEAYGGNGPDLVTPLLVSERLARASVAFAVSVSNCGDCVAPIVVAGSEEMKSRLLPPIVRGESVPCFCISEPSGGSDVAAMTTRATRDGDDYVITGRKMWITSAIVADVFVVFATVDPALRHKGITAFVVQRGAPGLEVGAPEELLGLHGSPTSEVNFDMVRVPATARLGAEGDGFALAMSTLDESRLNIAAVSLGAAASAIEQAVAYARQRTQFGKPIIDHQGLQFKISELATELASCRALWEKAVTILARDHSRQAGVYAAMAKLTASDLAMKAAIEAAQVMGGYGLTRSTTVSRLIRDCKALQIFEGTNEIQKSLIGRSISRHGLSLEEIETLPV